MTPSESKRERIERLEAENRALRRVNARLMRERIGSSNTAAASELARAPRSSPGPLRRLRLVVRRVALRLLR
jgi:hypothetical protein